MGEGTRRVGVVGCGIAGRTCVETLELFGGDEVRTVVFGCDNEEFPSLHGDSGTVLCRGRVTRIRAAIEQHDGRWTIDTTDSGSFNFDACVIATGAVPCVPRGVTIDYESTFVVRDHRSVEHLCRRVVDTQLSVAVVGGGPAAIEFVSYFINTAPRRKVSWVVSGGYPGESVFGVDIVMQRMRRLGVQIRIEDPGGLARPSDAARIKSSVLDCFGPAPGPTWMTDDSHGEEAGLYATASVTLYSNSTVIRTRSREGTNAEIILDSGRAIRAGVVVFATGDEPAHDLASGVCETNESGGGILVDAFTMKSSAPFLYACGDCATVRTESLPDTAAFVSKRVWAQSKVEGAAAAKSVLEDLGVKSSAVLSELERGPEFELSRQTVRVCDSVVVLLGHCRPELVPGRPDSVIVHDEDKDNLFLRAVISDERLRGAIIFPDDDVGVDKCEELILSGMRVSRDAISRIHQDATSLSVSLEL